MGSNSSRMRRAEFEELMNGGDCKEAYTAVVDYLNEAEEKRTATQRTKVFKTLEECIDAHSDYHQPIQPIVAEDKTLVKQCEEEYRADLLAKLRDYSGEGGDAVSERELWKRLPEFMKGGCCKESYTAWQDCKKMTNGPYQCEELLSKLTKCMVAHPDYYPMQAAVTYKKRLRKAIEAFFDLRSFFSN